MKPKPLADTREWKSLVSDIKKAKKDPEFRKALKEFIRKTTRYSREKLAKEIREAMKDPEMRKGIREFIKATS